MSPTTITPSDTPAPYGYSSSSEIDNIWDVYYIDGSDNVVAQYTIQGPVLMPQMPNHDPIYVEDPFVSLNDSNVEFAYGTFDPNNGVPGLNPRPACIFSRSAVYSLGETSSPGASGSGSRSVHEDRPHILSSSPSLSAAMFQPAANDTTLSPSSLSSSSITSPPFMSPLHTFPTVPSMLSQAATLISSLPACYHASTVTDAELEGEAERSLVRLDLTEKWLNILFDARRHSPFVYALLTPITGHSLPMCPICNRTVSNDTPRHIVGHFMLSLSRTLKPPSCKNPTYNRDLAIVRLGEAISALLDIHVTKTQELVSEINTILAFPIPLDPNETCEVLLYPLMDSDSRIAQYRQHWLQNQTCRTCSTGFLRWDRLPSHCRQELNIHLKLKNPPPNLSPYHTRRAVPAAMWPPTDPSTMATLTVDSVKNLTLLPAYPVHVDDKQTFLEKAKEFSLNPEGSPGNGDDGSIGTGSESKQERSMHRKGKKSSKKGVRGANNGGVAKKASGSLGARRLMRVRNTDK